MPRTFLFTLSPSVAVAELPEERAFSVLCWTKRNLRGADGGEVPAHAKLRAGISS